MTDFAEIRAKTRRVEKTAELCLAGDLFAEHEALSRQLEEATRDPDRVPESLADGDAGRELAGKIREVEARMREATAVFRFRALGRSQYDKLRQDHKAPEESGQAFADSFWLALVSSCCIDPVMSEADVAGLFEDLSEGQRDVLGGAAWEVNQSRAEVPFSLLASVRSREPARI